MWRAERSGEPQNLIVVKFLKRLILVGIELVRTCRRYAQRRQCVQDTEGIALHVNSPQCRMLKFRQPFALVSFKFVPHLYCETVSVLPITPLSKVCKVNNI